MEGTPIGSALDTLNGWWERVKMHTECLKAVAENTSWKKSHESVVNAFIILIVPESNDWVQ